MKSILLALSMILGTGSAYAQTVSSITGDIIGDYAKIQLEITVTGIAASQIKANAQSQDDYIPNLAIILPEDPINPNKPILPESKKANTTQNTTNPNFYWHLNSARISQDTGNLQKIVFNVTILSNDSVTPPQSLSSITTVSSGLINVNVRFLQLNSNGSYDDPLSTIAQATEKKQAIQKIFSSPSPAPANFSVTPTNRALQLKWEIGNVDYVPARPAINRKPDQVLVMIFAPNAGNVSLLGYKANATKTGDQVNCRFDSSASSCISCDDESEPLWITDEQSENDDLEFIGLTDNTGIFASPKLDPDSAYTVVLQYRQGAGRVCLQNQQPIVNFSLTELNGAPDAVEGDPRCFIVSAAFGSPFNRHVDIFRWARDYFLEPSPWGHALVEFYYEHSQPLADQIKASPFLQILVRFFLYPLAFLLYGLQESTEYPLLSYSMAALLLLSLMFIGMRRRTYRRS